MDKDNKAYFMTRQYLGKQIKYHRRHIKNYSQTKLAELANIDENTIGRIERAEQLVSTPNFIKLVDALDMDINEYIPIFRKLIDEDEADL